MKFSSHKVQEYLSEKRIGRIATATLNGVPHVTPMGFIYDNKHIYMLSYLNAKKVRQIKKNQRVSFVVDDTEGEAGWRYVIVSGNAFLCEKNQFDGLLDRYRQKFPTIDSAGYTLTPETMTFITINPRKVITANI